MHRHGGRIALVAAALLTLGVVGAGTVMAAQPAPAKVAKAGAVERLARHIVHGTIVIQRADGTLQTLQIDRGTISAVGGGTITVAEPGGSQTVATDAKTRVRKNGAKSSVTALAVGDKVLVVSDLTTGSPVADLVVVPRPRPTPLPARATP